MKILCGSSLGQVRLVQPESGKVEKIFFPFESDKPVKHITFPNSCFDQNINEMQFCASRGDWEIVFANTYTGKVIGKIEMGTPEEIEASKAEFELTDEEKKDIKNYENNLKIEQKNLKRKRDGYNTGITGLPNGCVPRISLFPVLTQNFVETPKKNGSKTDKGFSLVGLETWSNGEEISVLTSRKDGRIEILQFHENNLNNLNDDKDEASFEDQNPIQNKTKTSFTINAPISKARLFGNKLLFGGEDNTVKLYDIVKQKPVWEAEKLPADNYGIQENIFVNDMTLIEGGNAIVSVDANHYAYAYDIRDGNFPFKKASHSDFAFTSIAPIKCRNDHEVVFGTAVGKMFSWDFRDPLRHQLHIYRGTAGAVRAISAHPTDTRIVCSLSADRKVRVYHALRRNILFQTFCLHMQQSMAVTSTPSEKPVDSDEEEEEKSESEPEEENVESDEDDSRQLKELKRSRREYSELFNDMKKV